MEIDTHVIPVTGVQLAVSISIIGYRNHSSRLISLIDNNSDCILDFIYHPSKTLDDKRGTNDFSKILNSDVILISSPNNTHVDYIKKILSQSHSLIFCEKPPATSSVDLKYLEQLSNVDKSKIFFNFNYRYSKLSAVLEQCINSNEIGKMILINIIMSHGLAFKKEYKESWRSNGIENLHNVLDTLAIHFIDFLLFHFGSVVKINYYPSLQSKIGNSYDSCMISMEFEQGVMANVFTSYAAPYINEFTILGTNGYITIHDDILVKKFPRDTFDNKGFFMSPPTKIQDVFDIEDDYDDSLNKSLNYFILQCRNHSSFSISSFERSIECNRLIINLHDTKI